MVSLQQRSDGAVITLMPNRSASWKQTKWLISAMAFFVFSIAIAWSFVGAWVVLPFAGFEVGLLALLMYRVSYATYQQQIIAIDDSNISIETGVYRPHTRIKMDRHVTHLDVIEANTVFEIPALTLVNPRQQVIIGEFLNREDRLKTRALLKQVGIPVCSDQWWRHH
ncbi:DUF2244 domain-containing protein [Aestuariibacter salexigens]|uniref:DUF2244 domain-containing protein n=1 Tax=Aestuariibacter salexigens TaxID=226010 RepID=UPI0003F94264|nr:DUF2244 domain-containing protein [Aestuariibacter salexigens]